MCLVCFAQRQSVRLTHTRPSMLGVHEDAGDFRRVWIDGLIKCFGNCGF